MLRKILVNSNVRNQLTHTLAGGAAGITPDRSHQLFWPQWHKRSSDSSRAYGEYQRSTLCDAAAQVVLCRATLAQLGPLQTRSSTDGRSVFWTVRRLCSLTRLCRSFCDGWQESSDTPNRDYGEVEG